ncbi:MAG: hydrogenase expression/formation protein HypE [Pirellulaceae bacterium]
MSQTDEAKKPVQFKGLQCPVPLRDYPNVILGHGGGGKLSAELIEHVFLPAFGSKHNRCLADSTTLMLPGSRIAMTTDSYVVQPLFFPGGSIGDLAVNGTVNDLAMSGAKPLYLTAGFIIEEGFSIEKLIRIAQDMAMAADRAGVAIVAGDTKVVERGHGDGCYINTSGVGCLDTNLNISPDRALPGDVVIVSGTIGDHGLAVMSVREGLEFESPIRSDSAALNGMVEQMLAVTQEIHVLRDPTRGGVATSLNEIAQASGCGIVLEEQAIPVDPAVQSACEFLGLDPMLVANEGKLIAVVPEEFAQTVLAVMQQHPLGKNAAMIGKVVEDKHKLVVARTPVGATRIVTVPIGEQLPRIC